jgi:hypothetical protein
MANEQVGITVTINGTGVGIKSVKELKDAIKQLEDTASKADFGSEEFKTASEEAAKLKNKMKEISGAESSAMTNSLKGLQQEYKKLKVALSEATDPAEFARLSKELNDVEGQLGDINDAANLATGSGVEQLNKGISTVVEGFQNFDFGKVQMGFKAIGNAMSAVVPLLLIEGIALLIENFDKVVEVVKTVTGTFSDEEIALKKATAAYEAQKDATSALVAQYENELKILEAQGVSDEKLLQTKTKKIQAQIQELKASIAVVDATIKEIEANDDLSESLGSVSAWLQRKLGNDKVAEIYEQSVQAQKLERIQEQQDKREEALKTISSLETDLVVLQINNDKKVAESNKKVAESNKKASEERKKQAEIDGEARYQAWKAEQERMANEEAIVIPEQKEAIAQTELEINAAKNAELLNQSALKAQAELDIEKENAKKLAALKEQGRKELERKSFEGAKALSDAVFAIQIGNAKKGSAEELKLKKQQFNINKAFAVTQATIDGIRAVQTVLATYPTPFSIPIAIATGVTSAANIAKIASAKFEGGETSGGAAGSAPQIGTTSLPTPPTINTPQNNTNTSFDAQGNNLGISNQRQVIDITGKVIVTENDISEQQNRANKLKAQTTF